MGKKGLKIKALKNIDFDNEESLHCAVVKFIFSYFYDVITTGEFISLVETQKNRNLAFTRGYMKGTPDLLILNKNEKQNFSGFAIEFKSPSRDSYLSHNQQNMLNKLSQNGYKTLYSNDYNIIIHELKNYFKTIFYKCKKCGNELSNRCYKKHIQKCNIS